ncbi:MAG: hypothetical protein ACLPYM_06750, partial [Limisphaerales bacterium]
MSFLVQPFFAFHAQDDFIALVFGDILQHNIIRCSQARIVFDTLQHAGINVLPPLYMPDFVQDNGAFQPVTRHGLDIFPILVVGFNPIVNFGFGFRIGSLIAGFAGRWCFSGSSAVGRRCSGSCCAHNDLFFCLCFVELPLRLHRQSVFTDSMSLVVHWSRNWVATMVAPAWFQVVYVAALPSAQYTLQTGFAVSFGGNAAFLTSDVKGENISDVTSSLNYSQHKQFYIPLTANIWTDHNRYNILTDWVFSIFPQNTYGLGGFT